MAKLWQKDKNINKEVETFTVGNDHILDQKLIKYDCQASIAHAKMLVAAKVLTTQEFQKLEAELKEIIKKNQKLKFKIKPEDEDGHTAIENHLTKYLGELGKKIHTARSRNDQVLAALRLYEKHELYNITNLLLQLSKALKKVAKNPTKMPGYTHMQKAMPSSIKIWATSYAESMEDNLKLVDHAKTIINKNPLGTGAGYGIPIAINNDITKDALAFHQNFQSPLSAQNTRGKYEAIIANALTNIMLDLNKLSSDIILFSMKEFNFFTIPEQFTTGSSIMPQKKNPDVLELVRAKYSFVLSLEFQLKNLINNLPSGYHRDLQLTKEPIINSIETTKASIHIMTLIVNHLKINKAACENALTKELYKTEEVYKLVKQGIPFRDAYKMIKEKIK